ncbi:MAG: HD domain-containing protein [Candidatus Aenigmatarchaeota archaeon]|nr:MAG: HD domain-containing protein [Candidatus Aenigmarchaeota archaeon]
MIPMKKQFVNSFSRNGEAVEDNFAVKFKKPPVAYKGADKAGKWFELRLSDRTGEITAKYWGRNDQETERIYGSIEKGDVLHVKGIIQEYPPGTKSFSLSVDASKGELRKCEKGEYEPEDFVASSSKDTGKMLEELKRALSGIKNEHLRKLVNAFLDDSAFMDTFSRAPAAMEYHQNYIGGLLEHTNNMIRIINTLCDIHRELDRDVCLAGTFLHDIGKTKELGVSGGVIDVTDEGMMIGHITAGYEMLSKKIEQIPGFPHELKLKMLHIMLSHHGKLEYGAVKQPQTPEALAIYYADDADAQVDLYLRLKREANTDDQWIWNKKINGHIYLK